MFNQKSVHSLLKEVRAQQPNKDHFYYYIQLEHALLSNTIGYTKESLRTHIKKTYNVAWFPPRIRSLFEQQSIEPLVFSIIILESLLRKLSEINPDPLKKLVNEGTKGTVLEGINITKGAVDFSDGEQDIYADETALHQVENLLQVLSDQDPVVLQGALYEVVEKYNNIPLFFKVLQSFPAGILDAQRRAIIAPKIAEKAVQFALQWVGDIDIAKVIRKRTLDLPSPQQLGEQISRVPLDQQELVLFQCYRDIEQYVMENKPHQHTIENLRGELQHHIKVSELPPGFAMLFMQKKEQLLTLANKFIDEFIITSGLSTKVNIIDIIDNMKSKGSLLVFEENNISMKKTLQIISAGDSKPYESLESSLAEYISILYKKALNLLNPDQARFALREAYDNIYQRYFFFTSLLFSLLPYQIVSQEEQEDIVKESYQLFVEMLMEQITVDELKDALIPAFQNLTKKHFENRVQRQEEFSTFFDLVVKTLHHTLGQEGTGRIFEKSYRAVQEKFGGYPVYHEILTAIPRGILEIERFTMLSKDELEKISIALKKTELMKSQFTNIAAHELKTPLIPILGYAEMIMSGKKYSPKKIQSWGKIIYDSAVREQRLVDDLLAIAKLEAGEMKLEVETLNLVDLLKSVVKELLPLAHQKHLTLKTSIPKSLPSLQGDPLRLTQVVGNLLNNALKFTEKGTVTIAAKVIEHSIHISISDTGMGMKEEELSKVFQKFYQTEDYRTRKTRGTGLGLAICKEIISLHQGNIWVKSKGMGKGSTVVFTLPFTAPFMKKRKSQNNTA